MNRCELGHWFDHWPCRNRVAQVPVTPETLVPHWRPRFRAIFAETPKTLSPFLTSATILAEHMNPSLFAVAELPEGALSQGIAQARAILETEWAAKVPGLSIAVAVGGATIWTEQFGLADLVAQAPVTPQTRFRIGSVSKSLTAAGVALLVERGLLDLDAPVQKYIPDFPQKEGVITTRLLAGHLSGIRNYRGTEAVSNKEFADLRTGLKLFEADPLEAAPGTKFGYCSYNYNTIGVIMEAAAKQDFLGYMDEHVIKPWGLTNTRPDRARVVDAQRTQFYETDPQGSFVPGPAVNLSYVWPGGGFLSTADDLLRFGNAHLRPGFLKAESLRLLFTSQATENGTATNYGVGWFVKRPVVWHGGDSIGGTSILLLHPASCLVIAIVSNGGQGLLRNAIRRGNVPREMERFLFNKETIAMKIAKMFALLFTKAASGGATT